MSSGEKKPPCVGFQGGEKVEMSGIEPESERFDLQISTSVAGCQVSPFVPQPTKEYKG